jgi:Fe-S-cluster containining protein
VTLQTDIIPRRKNEAKSYSSMRKNTKIENMNTQHSCRQCGICCTKGGAALHNEDLMLLQDKKILRSDCITLRKGEFAYSPVTNKVEPIATDIIKLRGTGGEWICCHFKQDEKSCEIYENRPIACRTLKCWDPEDSLALAGNDLLDRETILRGETPLLELMILYESKFALPDFTTLHRDIKKNPEKHITILENRINKDLEFRDKEVMTSMQVAEEELFLFGRPLFQLLQQFGLVVVQKEKRLCLSAN